MSPIDEEYPISPGETPGRLEGLAARLAGLIPVGRARPGIFKVAKRQSNLGCGDYEVYLSYERDQDVFVLIQSPDDETQPGVVLSVNRKGTFRQFVHDYFRAQDNQVIVVQPKMWQFSKPVANPETAAAALAEAILGEIERIGVPITPARFPRRLANR